MAPSDNKQNHRGTMIKLPKIPTGSKVQKRPLTRRQPPASSSPRTIYISTSTPFMSAIKRCQKHLDATIRTATAAPKNASLQSRIEGLKRDTGAGSCASVRVTGTGRAVEKVVAVAGWFEQLGSCEVRMRTGTVGTVDDVIVDQGEDEARVRRVSCLELEIWLK